MLSESILQSSFFSSGGAVNDVNFSGLSAASSATSYLLKRRKKRSDDNVRKSKRGPFSIHNPSLSCDTVEWSTCTLPLFNLREEVEARMVMMTKYKRKADKLALVGREVSSYQDKFLKCYLVTSTRTVHNIGTYAKANGLFQQNTQRAILDSTL